MRHLFAVLGLTLALLPNPVAAASSDWISVTGGAVRLISAGPPEAGVYHAGLEFSLDPGWHTYWRFPGEAGIPPQTDFSASSNVGAIEMKFPAPARYDDGFTTSIVYNDGVVLPMLVTPAAPGQPVTLKADVFFGVCKEICVPGNGSFELTLKPDAAADRVSAVLINRDLALVPTEVNADASAITSITTVPGSDAPVLTIEASVTGNGTPDLFAEGPEGSYIGVPVLKDQTGNKAVWTLSTRGLAQTADGSELTLVLVDNGQASESRHHISATLLN